MRKLCSICEVAHGRHGTRFCEPCSRARFLFRRYASGAELAGKAISKEKAAGRLLPASAYKCVDCGLQAKSYDHRDYNKPLVVDPVCQRCNVLRRSASSRCWSFDEFMDWVKTSVPFKRHVKWSGGAAAIRRLRKYYFPEGFAVRSCGYKQ